MVFIVKIPNRSRANTPEASNIPSAQNPPQSNSDMNVKIPPLLATPNDGSLHAGTLPQATDNASISNSADWSTSMSNPTATTPPAPQHAAQLDVLLAPSVLNHKYVRGVDKSLIVERPERIRAVLLGVATAIGKSSKPQPPVSTTGSNNCTAADSAAAASMQPVPSIDKPTLDDDDLVARLSSLSVQSSVLAQSTPAQPQQKFRVLQSTRSLPLDPPHPAVACAHAHSDELVSVLDSAYDQAKQKRHDARARVSTFPATLSSTTTTLHTSSSAPIWERQVTPTPSSVATSAEVTPLQSAAPASATQTSHAAYLEYLCSRAPNRPPASQTKPNYSSPARSIPDDSETYTSSDGEGDDAIYPSEVPEHLPQGDLYLAGPQNEQSLDGGSSEAIRHAMGACCEAVDRVVQAATNGSLHTGSTLLKEIKFQASNFADTSEQASEEVAPPAKRAFVLCRPPGHHCSGSTPQGFCWVNNAIVAASHAYLTHSIDRVVIFDIDLHHGNGTQNLAWRINSDANKHDEERAERIASLRSAALDRARRALGAGSGRAHASKLAKVALSGWDEEQVKKRAGRRGLRLFYSSLHDIESFPCEDGDMSMIKDASVCVEGAHGQWIWNIHLDHYRNEHDFHRLYEEKYKIIFSKAARFLTSTSANPENTLILISAGFDACSYEYPGMQRHGKHVPPSFYHTFARDAVSFADAHAQGKLVSVLEGGYSDRALCSAALAHVTGLAVCSAEPEPSSSTRGEDETEYWKLENLIAVEKMAKKMAAHAAAAALGGSANTTPKRRQAELAPWLATTSRAFAAFETACGNKQVVPLGMSAGQRGTAGGRPSTVSSTSNSPATIGATGRVLRERIARRPAFESAPTPQASSSTRRIASPAKATPTRAKKESPSKRESPSKVVAARGSGPFDAPSTPANRETQGDESMHTDTPTKSTMVPTSTVLPSQTLPLPPTPTSEMPKPTQQHEQVVPAQSASKDAQIVPVTDAYQPLAAAFVTKIPFVGVKTESTGNGSYLPPTETVPTNNALPFIATSSNPQSPALTAEAVTLVDAMSVRDQILDANTRHVLGSPKDLLGLDSPSGQALRFANGDEDRDAEGSPDPEAFALDGNGPVGGAAAVASQEYFPLQRKDSRSRGSEEKGMPGGFSSKFSAFLGINLEHPTLAKPGTSPIRHAQESQQEQ
ncbi:related to HOS3 - Trichostatin A-insensitive homodimeric histone deacetylase (HDAC) [Melanopsichium pennsylvanicum]|uniref:Related to HOS3 - Trichostatin A-insensitive homodimeric histone deacetylase (HDAC) n=2 Tax=Melanopsichium pennsylvanicum TaxID=63383 RepID=A0AAJ4XR71_9BASI|nr:related to HOS3-Trichostatin A-insensitive homodimeric histone deacetylase (HDAC) [Melanopsichium pennsylvanicum 4]SNX86872.1 related to HOS3 - Trichostatin A-insensitive homodimeric histone deacetylase (HDAC) [Melanopsichium pennsylvanicum]